MQNLDSILKNGIFWGASEAFIFHGTLLIHSFALFSVLPLTMYGQIGVAFSACYILVNIATLGFGETIGALLNSKPTKELVQIVFMQQILCTAMLYFLGFILFIFLGKNILIKNIFLSLLIIGVSIAEIVKRIAKSFLSFFCDFKAGAYAEISLILVYVASVWINYAFGIPITPITLFIPLLICTSFSAGYIFLKLYTLYKNLKSEKVLPIVTIASFYTNLRLRLHSCFPYLITMIYSGNALVPLVALIFGTDYAGIIKLISNSLHNCISLFERVFGTMTTVLFSHTKNNQNQQAFSLATHYALPVLIGGSLFACAALLKIIGLHATTVSNLYIFTFTAIALNMCNIFARMYERFLLKKQQGVILSTFQIKCIINTLLLSLTLYVATYVTLVPITFFAFILLSMRIVYIRMLMKHSHKIWNIYPTFSSYSPHIVLSFAFFALIYYIF